MSKFLRSFVFVAIAFSFMLAACGTAPTAAPTAMPAATSAMPARHRDASIHGYSHPACPRLCYSQWLGKHFPSTSRERICFCFPAR